MLRFGKKPGESKIGILKAIMTPCHHLNCISSILYSNQYFYVSKINLLN